MDICPNCSAFLIGGECNCLSTNPKPPKKTPRRKLGEVDYVASVGSYGGSKKGRDVRSCPDVLKLAAQLWTIANLAAGNESNLIHNPNAGGRFSKVKFRPLLPLLSRLFPKEADAYFSGREKTAANCIMNRVHKMYYHNDTRSKGRGVSNERSQSWDPARKSQAWARLSLAFEQHPDLKPRFGVP